jgi:hypothetical protein
MMSNLLSVSGKATVVPIPDERVIRTRAGIGRHDRAICGN